MHDGSRRAFDVVLVWKLDRFGRSVRNCLDGIEALRAHGVRFPAIWQNIDTDDNNPTARLMLLVLATVADFERELIRERVASGVANARRTGKRLGRQGGYSTAEEPWTSDGRAQLPADHPGSCRWAGDGR